VLGFLIIVIAFLFIYLALLRPQRRKQVEQTRMWQSLQEGDEVVTAGGLYGTITGFTEDDTVVEIAPGLEVRVARRAIAGLIPPGGDDDQDDQLEEADEAVEEPAPEALEPAEKSAIADGESYPEGSR